MERKEPERAAEGGGDEDVPLVPPQSKEDALLQWRVAKPDALLQWRVAQSAAGELWFYFTADILVCESCSQFDLLPLMYVDVK